MSIMTELLYMNEFDVTTCSAVVVGVSRTTEGKNDVILDQTCFYPRGGGQDWDKGVVNAGGISLAVEEVRLDQEGNVHHIGTMNGGMFMVGEDVDCEIDAERRLINTRLHSGGHVLDMAVDSLGLDWVGTKGQHYPELSAIEYSGTWEPEKAEDLREHIEKRANEFVSQGYDTIIRFMRLKKCIRSVDTCQRIYRRISLHE